MNRRQALLLLSCLAWTNAFASAPTAESPEADVQEGYLNSLPKSFPKDRTLVIAPTSLVLRERFREWSSVDDAIRRVPSLDQVVASNLLAVCNSRVPVPLTASRLNQLPKIYLPSSAELSAVLGGGSPEGWGKFFKSYPRAIGLTQFSRVGFNGTNDEAAVFVYTRGDGYGSGEIAILRKADGKWYTHAWRGLWFDE